MKAADLAFKLYQFALEDDNWEVVLPNGCPVMDVIPHMDKKVIELMNWEAAIEKKEQ